VRHRRISAGIFVVTAGLAIASLGAAGPASASGPSDVSAGAAVTASSTGNLCDSQYKLCLRTQNGVSGTPVDNDDYTANSDHQFMETVAYDGCSGSDIVTTTCPFVQDYGLNDAYLGDYIVHQTFPDYSGQPCITDEPNASGQLVESESCTRSGTAWVITANSGFVNVYATNNQTVGTGVASPEYLCSTGTNAQQAEITPMPINANPKSCQWLYYSS
jgi:hypothetical protein